MALCPRQYTTSGYAVFLGDNLISWSSKRQNTISRFSAEAEYRAVANGVAEATWLRQLLLELHTPLCRTTLVYCDNISAVYMTSNPSSINAPSTSRLIYTSSENRLLLVIFVPCMYRRHHNMQTSSPRASHPPSLPSSGLV
jgi:hypothetical protein